ncbi:MAG: DUF6460 domain-containing protein [Tepidamorphaceae bacterium]|nr:integrase [Rhodobiaceae bacterium]MCC0050183.1 integrase [Rhodobiaceae bacterium]
MNNALDRFFGGPPLWVLVRLAILSLIVGLVLSVLNISPYDIIEGFRNLIAHLYDLGFGVIIDAFNYFLLGAVIVFPIWLIMRVMKTTSRDRHDS